MSSQLLNRFSRLGLLLVISRSAIAVLVLLAGAQAYAKTFSLPVVASGTWATTKTDASHSIIANCLNTLATPEGFLKGSVTVGYDYYYDPGTGPFPCWKWASTTYRGYVLFDLSQVKVLPINTYIKSARLLFAVHEPTISKTISNPFLFNTKVAGGAGTCFKAAYVAKTAWSHYAIPGIRLTTKAYDVTKFVRQWASGKMPNHGFFFVGTDESRPAKTNKVCYTDLYNFKLEVVTEKMNVLHFKDAFAPPKIVDPAPNHLFIKQDVNARVMATHKVPNPDRFEYEFEWQRADYHTKANNHYVRPNPKPTDFPLAVGQFSPFRAWKPPMQALTLAENGSVSTLHVSFSTLRSNRLDSSFEYRFRVREHLKATKAHGPWRGPWSGWRSFIVQELVISPTKFHSMHVQPGANQGKSALGHRQAPEIHPLSGHLNSSRAPKRYARAGSLTAHRTLVVAPHVKVLNSSESIDASCRNLAKFITLRETVVNEGGPLAAGQAHLFVKEFGGAHISSQPVPVPALGHGASTTVLLKAGTQGAYRSKIPGRHVLVLNMVVNGKTTTTKLIRSFRPGTCQLRHSAAPHRSNMKGHLQRAPSPRPMAQFPPKLRFMQVNQKIDYQCANLRKFITFHVTLYNDGGPLAARHGSLYVKEDNGYIAGPRVFVPPLAHGASKTVTLTAGMPAAHRGQVPGVHHLVLDLTVDGKQLAYFHTEDFGPKECQRQMRVPSPARMNLKVKKAKPSSPCIGANCRHAKRLQPGRVAVPTLPAVQSKP